MPKVTFVLKLEPAGGSGTLARMWLDTSRDDTLQPGEEVTPMTLDGKVWIARRDLPDDLAGMQFLVKFLAPAGTRWSFAATSGDTTHYAIADQVMPAAREALAGRLS